MNWLQTLAVVIHVLLAAGIIGLVLLQRGKGADAGAGFGAGASGTVFGARGSASFLSRTTAVLATLFFLSSLGLSYLFSQRTEPTSVVDRVQEQQAPVRLPSLPPAQQLPVIPSAPPAASAPAPSVPAATVPAPSAPVAGSSAPAQSPPPSGKQ
jgi:preprotein translocase subunit SecG